MSASGIIAVFMTVIQLLFPMMGDVSYQGLYELEVDGVPFSCRLSLDTDDPTLDATVQAEGSPLVTLRVDDEMAFLNAPSQILSLSSQELLTMLEGLRGFDAGEPLRWEALTDYLTGDGLASDVETLGQWLGQLNVLPAPALLFEDGQLVCRYTFDSTYLEMLFANAKRMLVQSSLENMRLEELHLWEALGLEAETCLESVKGALYYALNSLSHSAYMEDFCLTVTLVTDISQADNWKLTPIQKAKIRLVTDNDRMVWEADISAGGISGTVSYLEEPVATFLFGNVDGCWTLNVAADEVCTLQMTLGDGSTPFSLTMDSWDSYLPGRVLDVTLSDEQLRFFLSGVFLGSSFTDYSGCFYIDEDDALAFQLLCQTRSILRTQIDGRVVWRPDGLDAAWQYVERMPFSAASRPLEACQGSLSYRFTLGQNERDERLTVDWTQDDTPHNLTYHGAHRWE